MLHTARRMLLACSPYLWDCPCPLIQSNFTLVIKKHHLIHHIMKKNIIAAALMTCFMYAGSHAQSYTSSTPSSHKVLVDNEKITATEVTFLPGQKTDTHTHPAHFIYALTDGSLTVYHENGKTDQYDLKTGDSAYIGPEGPHATINTGKMPVKLLLVEFKDDPYMPDGKMKK
jgi:quercetin dioxygenase-like cupin family protein